MELKEEIHRGLQPHNSYDLDVLKSLAAVEFAKFKELKNRSSAAVSATICDVLGFVSTVLLLYAESSNPFKNFMAELGYNTQDNKQARITKAARRAWDAYLSGDKNYSLPAMAFLGAVMQRPREDTNCERLEESYKWVEQIRQSIFRVRLPMPAPYKTVEEFIVNAMLLGSAFSIQSGLQRLRNREDLFAKPIIEYNSLSYESKRVWFIGMTKLAEIRFMLDSGSYNIYETVMPPLDCAPLTSGVSLLETGNSDLDKDDNE